MTGNCNNVAYQQEFCACRWHEAQKPLRTLPCFDCEWFLDAMPALVCTYGGKYLCMQSLPDSEEIVDICPHSGGTL
jgi:hypothetical protein